MKGRKGRDRVLEGGGGPNMEKEGNLVRGDGVEKIHFEDQKVTENKKKKG